MYLFLYLRAAGKIWWGTMSCAIFTFIGGYAAYANKDNTWIVGALFSTSFILTIVSGFLAWKEKEKECEGLRAKLSVLEASAHVPPVQNIYFPAPPVPVKPEPLKHNVQCIGVTAGEKAAQIGFINIETPNREVGNFHRARLKVRYSVAHSGEEVALVFPARWIGSDEDEIAIEFVPRYAVLAVYIGNQWHGVETVEVFTSQSESESYYRRELRHLPTTQLSIEAILLGENNLSLPPFTGILTLGEDGSASWTLTEQ